jgi:tetratricopeptide (TPR) repeat protein
MPTPSSSIHALMESAKSGQMPLDELFQSASHLQAQGQAQSAQDLYKIWIACSASPSKYAAFFNWGVLMAETGNADGALLAYEECLKLNPELHQARINLGLMLERKGLHAQARAMWEHVAQATATQADTEMAVIALNHLGRMQETQKNFELAEQALERSLTLQPHQPDAIQHWVHLRQKQCKWPVLNSALPLSTNQLLGSTSPLAMLALKDDPALQWLSAQTFVHRKYPFQTGNLSQGVRYAHEKIRIGYLSGDLCTHAVGLLMADLIEAHDKSKFEIFAFDFSPEDASAYRLRLRQAFDHFIDIKAYSDADAATLIRQCEIDVLIDIHGLSSGARPAILAQRPSPIQATYLGFIGTTAMPWLDYVIADRFALPEALTPYFCEQPIYVEGSFIPLHRPPEIQAPASREAFGFTPDQTVLACFNNIYKITPEMLACWMKILQRTEHSVLWLLDDNPWATHNLKQQATQWGLAHRLVFSGRCSHAEYLARLNVADLYLDTSPYNAGSTARDVLDAQLPMVTLSGQTFISRMAGSMLHAANLDALITYSQDDYQHRVVQLVNDKDQRTALRKRMAQASDAWAHAPQQLVHSLEHQLAALVAKRLQA